MPLDYSRFTGIGDSDSEDSQRGRGGLDFSQLFPKGEAPDSPPESPRAESPRTALLRTRDLAPAAARVEELAGSGAPADSADLERFLALSEGAEQTRSDDSVELLAVARATLQSSLSDKEEEAPLRLLRSLTTGLGRSPKAVDFAREQAPELAGELLAMSCSGLVPVEECEGLLELLVEKCKPRELYTFLIEAICSDDLPRPAWVKGIRLLYKTLLRMDIAKRHLFLGSCLPAMLKKACEAGVPPETVAEELTALRLFAMEFLPREGTDEMGPAKVAASLVAAFLCKLLLKAVPVLAPVESLLLKGDSVDACKRPRVSGRQHRCQDIQLCCTGTSQGASVLSALARDAASACGRPLHSILEEMDVGEPTSDGGGDLEISPLSLAALVCVLEFHGCRTELQQPVLPISLSAARLVNIIMRACFVLVSNSDVAPCVVSVGEEAAASKSRQGPRWAHRGFALFAGRAASLVKLASSHSPQAFTLSTGPLCRWYPARTLQAVLEALATSPDIEREVRGALFNAVGDVFRAFAWPCRFELYHTIISKCRVDSIMGATVTLFKDDWWSQLQAVAESTEKLSEERARLTKVFKGTLSGDLQIVDGMDTLTATLNLARLVALARAPAGPFIREALQKGGPGVDLDAMLAGVSRQIDCELGMLEKGGKEAIQNELAEVLEEALGKIDGVDLQQMKRDRITMVAHLVARVRELLKGESP